jgi:hypothetical protein
MEEIHVITMTISSLRIRPSTIPVRFQAQIKRIGKKSSSAGVKNFHNVDSEGILRIWLGKLVGNWMGVKLEVQ